MSVKVESIIANPSLNEKPIKIIGYILSTGLSTLFGIWANRAIKVKATTMNPSIVDGLQIGAGVGIAMIKNPYAQAIGVGQGIAGGVSLMENGIASLKAKFTKAPETTSENASESDTFG